jgi:hypothetical protein
VKKYQATIDYLTQGERGAERKVADKTASRKKAGRRRGSNRRTNSYRAVGSEIPPEVRWEIQQRHNAAGKGRKNAIDLHFEN